MISRIAPRLTIITYHLVGGGTGSPVDIQVAVFRSHLEAIREQGTAVSLEEGVAILAGEKEPPVANSTRPLVTLTFDDAFENFYSIVWPELAGHGVPATLFVPVGFVKGDHPAPLNGAEGLPPVSWVQLREMLESELLTVGSHTWSHCDIRHIVEDQQRVAKELGDTRKELEDHTGREVRSFCYPRGLWSKRSERLVAKYYDLAVVSGGRAITGWNLQRLRLWRSPVKQNSPADLRKVIGASVYPTEWLADKWRRRAW